MDLHVDTPSICWLAHSPPYIYKGSVVFIVVVIIYHLLFQTEYARFDKGRFVYRINRSPMCDYMVSFIHRLKHLPEKYMMNSVLENFTILQVSWRVGVA